MQSDINRIEFKKILEYSELSNKSVLEVGCGNGRVTEWIQKIPRKLIAIDPDKKKIESARQNVRNLDFKIMSGENLDFDDEIFDIVLFTFSLHHQNSTKALDEAYRVLKKNGRAVIVEPAADSEVERIHYIFENEIDKLEKAIIAIKNSPFLSEKNEEFFIEVSFDDIDELFEYFFNYYEMESNKSNIKQIEDLLRNKINLKPITLSDKTHIYDLRKQ
jgi:ubiquinone/menaquinone biosynthesis C-methylase UbiE